MTATDLVLTVTQMLRKRGVVDKFVEFYGDGPRSAVAADRATIANMAPEYGATMGFFPVDDEALRTCASPAATRRRLQLVERYCKEQGLFRRKARRCASATRSNSISATVEASLAGPSRPQDRIPLRESKASFAKALPALVGDKGDVSAKVSVQHHAREARSRARRMS